MADEKYRLAPAFERGVSILTACDAAFYGRIGYALRPELLADPVCALLVRAAQAVAKDIGRGPGDASLALQRLASLCYESKVSDKEVDAVARLLLDGEALDPENAIAELTPVLRRRIETDALKEAMDVFGRRGRFDGVVQKLDAASRLGQADTTAGMRLGQASFLEIDRMCQLDRLATPVPDLTIGLNGGLPRGGVALVASVTNGGKSLFLCDQATVCWMAGGFVVYATLELPPGVIHARVIADATGIPIDTVISGVRDEARSRLDAVLKTAGILIVQEFPAQKTTMPDLVSWVEACELQEGRPVDLVVIDYIDKVRSHVRGEDQTWTTQNTTIEYFRLFLVRTRKWGWTASQVKRRDPKARGMRLESDDLSDSMGKARVANLIVTVNADPQKPDMISLWVPKFSFGRSQFGIGPFPHDFACGRVAMQLDPLPGPAAGLMDF